MPPETAIEARARPAATRMRGQPRAPTAILVMTATLVVVFLVALSVGRYPVPLGHVLHALTSGMLGSDATTEPERTVVVLVRLPRLLLAVLVGGGLGLAGAALQATFRNPLVSPEIIGVSAGASFGGALAILLGLGSLFLVGGAFVFGLSALGLLFVLTLGRSGTPMLMVVLGGVVVGSFFSALVAMATYVADPYTTLPAIVFWLLGSVAAASFTKVVVAAVPILAGVCVVLLLRWRLNVLSLGDEEARALGMNPARLRWVVLVATSLVVAGAVAVSGVIAWVGLVVPHLVRMWVGPDHRVLLPVSFLAGAVYLLVIDTLARTMTAGEIPLGVLTAMIGAPVFFVVLRRNRDRVWDHA